MGLAYAASLQGSEYATSYRTEEVVRMFEHCTDEGLKEWAAKMQDPWRQEARAEESALDTRPVEKQLWADLEKAARAALRVYQDLQRCKAVSPPVPARMQKTSVKVKQHS
jgi:hypothetical protein